MPQGPTLVVSAGVHGDEYEGVRAIYELFRELDPALMRGTLLCVPVLNPPAHRACSRVNPTDGLNLARVFPGDPDGSVSHRIAWVFDQEILSRASFYLDLHSGGVRYGMPSMVGYDNTDMRGLAAAEAIGAPVVWGHPVIEPGRTISAAKARGIPFLYTEAWGAGRIAAADLAMMKRGIVNLMRHLRILDGEPDLPDTPPRRLTGVGNTDGGLVSSKPGFLMLDVAVLDRVQQGQRLGYLVDEWGTTVEEYKAPLAATVGLTREMPIVEAGDTLFLLAEEL
jgi:predicted deacylase